MCSRNNETEVKNFFCPTQKQHFPFITKVVFCFVEFVECFWSTGGWDRILPFISLPSEGCSVLTKSEEIRKCDMVSNGFRCWFLVPGASLIE